MTREDDFLDDLDRVRVYELQVIRIRRELATAERKLAVAQARMERWRA